MPHTDALSEHVGGDQPEIVGCFGAVQDDIWVVVYPRLFHRNCIPGGAVVAPQRVKLRRGGYLLFRGDLVHCESENLLSVEHRRAHSYIHRWAVETVKWSGQGHVVTLPAARAHGGGTNPAGSWSPPPT